MDVERAFYDCFHEGLARIVDVQQQNGTWLHACLSLMFGFYKNDLCLISSFRDDKKFA